MTHPLTGKQRRHLRSLAHAHKPLVRIGHAGLTDGVLSAIDQALESHELVKIKISADAPAGSDELSLRIEQSTRSNVAQVIGRTLVVYRPRKHQPSIVLPKAEPRPAKNEG